ncbi:TonB-dependent receptor [Parvularcula sp. LCG005]|uniref:TonB-dependent receptor n=1 Tax=Parvularcula sp. LCG005 TaxID=3078805 RepID=UPI0029434FE0|nr:TonB-dependent receptor [Parvularcula sp. LCG005]WOI53935.1 TonB-dependent receptor [Parvularcula sp. LCG005]
MQSRYYLLSTVSIIAALGGASALAQTDDAEDIIVVQGTKLSRERGLEEKRNANQIIDALSVDELGQLPDKNIGESLNRLPGVSMLVEKGEGRYVQIRGINPSLNNVTINGANLGSPETEGGGRQAPLDIIAGGVLGAVQVIKAPTPDMDGQGIGGTVNVQTKSPFDREEQFYGYVTGRYGFEEIEPEDEAYGGHNPYGIDGTISGKNADQTFGWLLAGSWSDREYIAPGFYQDDWAINDADSETGSTGGAAPVNIKNNYYVIGRERLNLNGVLEFRPTDASRYYARAFYSSWDEYQHRNRYGQNFDTDIVFDTPTSGTSGENRIEANIRLEDAEKQVLALTFGGENQRDNMLFQYEVNANRNEIEEPNDYWEFRSGKNFGPNEWVMSADGIVTITPGAGTPDRQDPSLIDFRRVRFTDSSMQEDGLSATFDLTWDLDDRTYVKFGAKANRTERDRDYQEDRYDGGALDLTLGTDPAFTNGAFTNCLDKGCAPNIFMDIGGMNAFFDNAANADYFELNTGSSFVEEYAADYSLEETVLAGYGMGVREWGGLQVIAGVRVEATEINSEGYLLEDEDAVRIKDGGDYVSVLPGLLANLDLTESVKLRGSVTRAVGRPDFDQVAPRSNYNEELGIANLSIGNPDLEARHAWNYDASIEWYPNNLTLLSAAVFRKDISDELVGLSERYTTQSDIAAALEARGLGSAVDPTEIDELNISTTVNGGDSELTGLELAVQTQLDSLLPPVLAGFGVSASATFLDGETSVNGETLPLLNQAEKSYAFSAFYQNHGLDASVSYSYNDSFLTDVNLSDSTVNLDQGEFGRWDAKISYEIMDDLKIFIEGVNLNDEPTTEFQGGREQWNTEYEYVGRSIYLGASYGF